MTEAENAAVEFMLEHIQHGVPGADEFNKIRDALLMERKSPACVEFLRPYRKALEDARVGWRRACDSAKAEFGESTANASIDLVTTQERPDGSR